MTIINAVTLHTVTVNWVKCILDIKVVLNTYDTDEQCYDISYKWTFEDNKRKYNPFYNDSDFMENSTAGEIVYKNCLTDALVSCLVMSDEELEKVSGTATAQHYRMNIIQTIAMFWD